MILVECRVLGEVGGPSKGRICLSLSLNEGLHSRIVNTFSQSGSQHLDSVREESSGLLSRERSSRLNVSQMLHCLLCYRLRLKNALTRCLLETPNIRTPFFEPLCITLSTSCLKRLLLILLKLLTLLLQLSTCNVEILPLVIKALIRLINLPTLNSQILLLLSKGALLIHHRAVHFLRCGLIVTQRINIGFNLPSPFEHELLKVCMIPTELSLPAYLPSLIITYIAMLAIGSGELATQLPRVLRIRRKRISKHMNVRSRF